MSASDKACEVCGCVCYMSHLYRIEDMWDRSLIFVHVSYLLHVSHVQIWETLCRVLVSHVQYRTSYLEDLIHCRCETWSLTLYMWVMMSYIVHVRHATSEVAYTTRQPQRRPQTMPCISQMYTVYVVSYIVHVRHATSEVVALLCRVLVSYVQYRTRLICAIEDMWDMRPLR